MATKCKAGGKKVKGRCVPKAGYKFKKGGKGSFVKAKGSSSKKSSKRSSSKKCGYGLKKRKGGGCALKKGFKWGKSGKPVKA